MQELSLASSKTTAFCGNCGFYLYYLVTPPCAILTPATGQFLSLVYQNESKVSACGVGASCEPFLSSHNLACHTLQGNFHSEVVAPRLALSSSAVSTSAPSISAT